MILGPNGTPLSGQPQHTALLGYIVLRNEGKALVPMTNDAGHMAIFQGPQPAIDVAKQMADAELRPRADQKVLAPLMKSRQYLVIQCAIVGQIQAEIKNPEQLLAPADKGVN